MTRLSGRLNKEGVEGHSDRHELISLVQDSTSYCLLSRHTTDPQSLPSTLVPELERNKCESNRRKTIVRFVEVSVTSKTTSSVAGILLVKNKDFEISNIHCFFRKVKRETYKNKERS